MGGPTGARKVILNLRGSDLRTWQGPWTVALHLCHWCVSRYQAQQQLQHTGDVRVQSVNGIHYAWMPGLGITAIFWLRSWEKLWSCLNVYGLCLGSATRPRLWQDQNPDYILNVILISRICKPSIFGINRIITTTPVNKLHECDQLPVQKLNKRLTMTRILSVSRNVRAKETRLFYLQGTLQKHQKLSPKLHIYLPTTVCLKKTGRALLCLITLANVDQC